MKRRVLIEDSADLIGIKVVRVRENEHGVISYGTKDGFVNKEKNKPIIFDETMIWEKEELLSLINECIKKGIVSQVR